MHVTRRADLSAYAAPKHYGMVAFRLQGLDASPAQKLWVGVSLFLPGGGAEKGASSTEKVYVVLAGAITVATTAGEATLGQGDSILIEADEERVIENRTAEVAEMLVISPR